MNNLVSCNAVSLTSLTFPSTLRLLVLAPHPDDFDAIGVSLRFFQQNGNALYAAIATSGASGVEDEFCSPPTVAVKAHLREREQQASCRFFGLPKAHLEFLRLEEDEAGHPCHNEANFERIHQHFLVRRPDIVFMPHGHDTNPGHKRIYEMFCRLAQAAEYPMVAFLNRDPKTLQMRCDVYLEFGQKAAAWKGELLRLHQSQHQRNLNQRGYGLDERILRLNQQSADDCGLEAEFAEMFELEFFRASALSDFVS